MRALMHLKCILGLVALVTEVAVVWAVVGMCPHVLTYMPNSLEQLPALTTLVPALGHVHLHVLLQHVAGQEFLLTCHTLKWLAASMPFDMDAQVSHRSEHPITVRTFV